jgi:hypothetical protein
MTKREEIDQLKHDYFMLSKRVESLELQIVALLDKAKRWGILVPEVTWEGGKINKTPPDIKHFEQKAHQPKINDNTKPPRIITAKPPWIITAEEVAPKPYAHPCCED